MREQKLIRLILTVFTGIILVIAAASNFNSGVFASKNHDECGESSSRDHSSNHRDEDDDCDDDDDLDNEDKDDDRDNGDDRNDDEAEDHSDGDENDQDEDEDGDGQDDEEEDNNDEDEDEASDDNDESDDDNGNADEEAGQDQGQSQEQKQKVDVNVNVEQKQENNQTVNVAGQIAGVSTVPVKQPETGPGVLCMASIAGVGPLGLLLARYGRGRITAKKEEDLTSIASGIVADRLTKKSS